MTFSPFGSKIARISTDPILLHSWGFVSPPTVLKPLWLKRLEEESFVLTSSRTPVELKVRGYFLKLPMESKWKVILLKDSNLEKEEEEDGDTDSTVPASICVPYSIAKKEMKTIGEKCICIILWPLCFPAWRWTRRAFTKSRRNILVFPFSI